MRRVAILCVVALAAGGAGAWLGRLWWERRPYRPRAVADLPGPWRIVDVHEHIASARNLPPLLRLMDEQSVERVVLVGSSRQTLGGVGGFSGHEENNAAILAMAAARPDRVTAFVTLDPRDPEKLARLKSWIARGARGLKLYGGHGSFHAAPLDDPAMEPVYAFCEREGVPIVLHVNMAKYGDEFRRVLDAHPRLVIDCPHFCMSTIRHERIAEMLSAYPSLYMDVSFGADEVAREGFARIDQKAHAVREIVLRHSDRFLFAADLVVAGMAGQTLGWMRGLYVSYRGLLERPRFRAAPSSDEVAGLALPPDALRRIYEDNPRRFLGLDRGADGR